ncbi:guanitoxin biosynthesis heme-dependent pre-guanitoxin N-hydroxylase GntA [Emcibacter sp. SYSU 3D8]|uniref:guanitoxin biosynthesis heme-dependent pre-guanitoxin N-hydroxylase GntA n=1 Tax=Emcibacter sp. SYSU 3D8 TaxID=3133969 RepID=UPI0031FE47DA
MRAFSRHPTLANALADFIRDENFPCVGAKSALARAQITVVEAGDLRDDSSDQAILRTLYHFIARYRADSSLFSSFAVAFEGPGDLDEVQFEEVLWQRLAALHQVDSLCYDWSPEVSPDPVSPRFGFSLGGMAFFIVGLHPNASRTARRFAHPAFIFNPHEQFEILRADGRYQRLKDVTVTRDSALDGFPNPMLAEHGSKSEAPQYSGREVGPDWRCPFRPV